ncbi:30S ribosome-binding factor RbfA [Glaciecola sp. 1036]|uniref:30S ribosome-binding factor RbfA n=1 Tax=Alteromonadaceae TaxID=72275 RepID=UPI003D04D6A5
MAREFSRTDRVSQQLHKEIALILQHEFKHRHPEVGMITLSEVEVSKDLSHAKVFISFFLDDEEKNKADFNTLKESASFIRGLLAKRIRMRSTPALHFMWDTSMLEGARISALVDKAIASDKNRNSDD